jgi:hypothetical protein
MSKRLFSATAVLAICIASSGSAFAGSISTVGSDNSTDTYAGDPMALLFQDMTDCRHEGTKIKTSHKNSLAALTEIKAGTS